MQDLDGQGFGGLLCRMAVHEDAGMGKTREERIKMNFCVREAD
jgi:hypothetical protein